MATATLRFNLSDPDDRDEHERCVKSLSMAKVIWHFMYNTKKGIKFVVDDRMDKDPKFDCFDAVDLVFDKFYEMVQEENISIDDLYK